MCLVVDTCSFHLVFGQENIDYEPVRNWLFAGNGKLVIGGTSYNRELSQLRRYNSVLVELQRQGKLVRVQAELVDEEEDRVRNLEPNPDFDDPHIVALVSVSRCRIVCTTDSRSDQYLRMTIFYRAGARPSIYRSRNHRHLLSDSNIVGACRRV